MSSAITSIPPPPTDQQEKKEEEYDEVKYLDIVYRQEMEKKVMNYKWLDHTKLTNKLMITIAIIEKTNSKLLMR
jgi:hypothetical protein